MPAELEQKNRILQNGGKLTEDHAQTDRAGGIVKFVKSKNNAEYVLTIAEKRV